MDSRISFLAALALTRFSLASDTFLLKFRLFISLVDFASDPLLLLPLDQRVMARLLLLELPPFSLCLSRLQSLVLVVVASISLFPPQQIHRQHMN
jgi:hypothetical protein